MNYKKELEKLIIRYENSPMTESEFLDTIRNLINTIVQPDARELIINFLTDEYTLTEAIQQVNESEVTIKGNKIKVTYKNGKSDNLELVAIKENAQPDAKDNLRIEIATKIFCELIKSKVNANSKIKDIINDAFEIADAIIERGKAK